MLLKYIVLKKWQDYQHGYYIENILPVLWQTEEEYIKIFGNELPFKVENAQMLRKIRSLLKNNLVSLDEISKCLVANMENEITKFVGGKAYGLAILNLNGAIIPKTNVIPFGKNIDEINLAELCREEKYAIRSSANIEDGIKHSFAGIFDSYIDIDYNEIKNNIKKVLESVNNSRVQSYLEAHRIEERPNMAVIIQTYKEPEYSGVFIGSGASKGMLEWVTGNGEKLVSGQTTPNREIWDDNTKLETTLKFNKGIVGEMLLKLQDDIWI